jgi:hypothetical protein
MVANDALYPEPHYLGKNTCDAQMDQPERKNWGIRRDPPRPSEKTRAYARHRERQRKRDDRPNAKEDQRCLIAYQVDNSRFVRQQYE